jgi:hypothetical protein
MFYRRFSGRCAVWYSRINISSSKCAALAWCRIRPFRLMLINTVNFLRETWMWLVKQSEYPPSDKHTEGRGTGARCWIITIGKRLDKEHLLNFWGLETKLSINWIIKTTRSTLVVTMISGPCSLTDTLSLNTGYNFTTVTHSLNTNSQVWVQLPQQTVIPTPHTKHQHEHDPETVNQGKYWVSYLKTLTKLQLSKWRKY